MNEEADDRQNLERSNTKHPEDVAEKCVRMEKYKLKDCNITLKESESLNDGVKNPTENLPNTEKQLLFGIDAILSTASKAGTKSEDINMTNTAFKLKHDNGNKDSGKIQESSLPNRISPSLSHNENRISPLLDEQTNSGHLSTVSHPRATFHPYMLTNQISMWPWKEIRRERIGSKFNKLII